MIINKYTINRLDDLPLHDAEINEITCNYDKHIVKIPIKIYNDNKLQNQSVELRFEDVLRFDISFIEPWGSGIYIIELIDNGIVEIGNLDKRLINISEFLNITILLNSGDKINVVASKLIYSCKQI